MKTDDLDPARGIAVAIAAGIALWSFVFWVAR